MDYTIVGNGNIGSILALLTTLKTYDGLNVKRLRLIDDDVLEEKNLPYCFRYGCDSKIILGLPKSYILKNILIQYGTEIEIESVYDCFENCSFNESETIFDCRDTDLSDMVCTYKLSLDGPYGKIIYKPSDKLDGRKNRKYDFNNSKYYAVKFCTDCLEFIKNKDLNTGMYIVNYLNKGEFQYVEK